MSISNVIEAITFRTNAGLKLLRWFVIGGLVKGPADPEKGTKKGARGPRAGEMLWK